MREKNGKAEIVIVVVFVFVDEPIPMLQNQHLKERDNLYLDKQAVSRCLNSPDLSLAAERLTVLSAAGP